MFWSDSQTVIQWVKSDFRKYRPFVAFRIADILEKAKSQEWFWIPTKQNVADDATKWTGSQSFVSNSRWFRGPEFLIMHEENWPEVGTRN